MKSFFVLFVLFVLSGLSGLSWGAEARTPPPYYQYVAEQMGVPITQFYAIALNESGLSRSGAYQPWPWTLNINGKGYRYDNYHGAEKALMDALKAGKQVDVGIMQINAYWHGHRVDHIAHLLLPHVSLIEGAKILLEQRQRSQDWWEAVGRYHAPGNDAKSRARAKRYRERVRSIVQGMTNV